MNRSVVRYGQMRHIGEYENLEGQSHPRGQRVVVRSDRGTEIGEILCPSTERTALFLENPFRGQIIRIATAEDLAMEKRLADRVRKGLTACQEFAGKRRLQMDLVDV